VITNSHDHLFFRSALLPGQELDDRQAAIEELRRFRELGGRRVVQWTPYGLGRRAEWLAEVAEAAGVEVLGATGLHQRAHYGDQSMVDAVLPKLADLFVEELTAGMRPDDPAAPPGAKAAMIKVAGAFHHLDAHAEYTMRAAAAAHHATGAPIGIHHELGTAAPDTVALLIDELGVAPEKVILGHLNRQPDPVVQLELARSGAFLAFDGPSRANHATDWRLYECLAVLADAGHAGQVLLGGDTTTAAARAGPGMAFLLRSIWPRLGTELAERFFVANPARAFGGLWADRPACPHRVAAGLRCGYAARDLYRRTRGVSRPGPGLYREGAHTALGAVGEGPDGLPRRLAGGRAGGAARHRHGREVRRRR
jgi:phosphotriesterase-related protein